MAEETFLERAAEGSERLYRKLALALESSQIGIWEHNLVTDEVIWDKRLCEIYEVEFNATIVWLDHVHPQDRSQASAEFDDAIRTRSSYSSQFRILLPDGRVRHLRSRAHYYEDHNGIPFYIGAEWDVTADVLMQEELMRRAQQLEESYRLLEYSALHDYLSGLPNRHALNQFLSTRGTPETFISAVLHIDLDNFKEVNDRLGHHVGDQVLRAFSVRLAAILPVNGFAARTGGDEFIVILDHASLDTARVLAERILEAAAATRTDVDIAGIDIGASVGLAYGRASFEQLLAQSDLALYQAKDLGRRRYQVFDEFPIKPLVLPVAMRH